jgi:hypothetical protein
VKISNIISNTSIEDKAAAIAHRLNLMFAEVEKKDQLVQEVCMSREDIALLEEYSPDVYAEINDAEIGEPVGYLWGAEVIISSGDVRCSPLVELIENPTGTLAVSCKRPYEFKEGMLKYTYKAPKTVWDTINNV